jgi:protease I
MERVLLLAGDAAESLEVLYPMQRLREDGYAVEVAAPKRKVLQTVIHESEPSMETYTEKPGYRVQADLAFAEAEPAEYVGLYIVGGRAPEYIRHEPGALELVRSFFELGKPVAAICHGPLLLTAAALVEGRTMTAYPMLRPEIEAAGGKFVDREVVVDGNLITARSWADHPAIMREYIRVLRGVPATIN